MNFSTYEQSAAEEIRQLFSTAFSDSEGPDEGLVIGNLAYDLMKTTDSQDIYGFVATENERIVGSIFFTRMTFESNANAFILSPVAVHTSCQGKGVGQKLIKFGLKDLQQDGVKLVFTYGDPKFYSRVGFRCITEETARAPFRLSQPEGWLCQSLAGDDIEPVAGNSRCVDALNKPEYW